MIQMSGLVFKYLMHLLVWRIKQTKIIANSKNKTSVMQKHSKMHKQSSNKAKVKDILQKGKKEKKKGKERKKTKK